MLKVTRTIVILSTVCIQFVASVFTKAQSSEMTSPTYDCAIYPEARISPRGNIDNKTCEALIRLHSDMEYARNCDAHENRVINMSNYNQAKCNTARMQRLRRSMKGNYPSTLVAPMRFPEGSETLNFFNPEEESASRKRFDAVFSDTFSQPKKINGKNAISKETEATFYIRDICNTGVYKTFANILAETKLLTKYSSLYRLSCSRDSKMRYFGKPLISFDDY